MPMTRDEAVDLLEQMAARWPDSTPDIDELAFWRDRLERLPYANGTETVRQLIASAPTWPTTADFQEIARAVAATHAPPVPDPAQPSPAPPEIARRINEARERIAAAQARGST